MSTENLPSHAEREATGLLPGEPSAGSPGRPAAEGSGLRADLAAALRYTVPVAMGYLPLGAAFGLLLVSSGLPWFWAPVTALVVFAGSLEFLAVTMITSGLALPAIALTTFLVNFRHVFYGLSFPLHLLTGRMQRAYGVFALTDETYSLLTSRPEAAANGRRVTLIQLLSHAYWIGGSLAGALASTALPDEVSGVEFALTALFVVLAWDHVRKRVNRRPVAYGLLASAVAWVLGGDQFLTVAVVVFLALLALDFAVRGRPRA
ncbi:AzlC family ABC transporter permease [Streptomyces sp. NPDC006367]|uniref:AzlC family ABC transporter permease n=1 Tax=unclassified Streptomyces TaxID=2593676 RepID=UPI0033A03F40